MRWWPHLRAALIGAHLIAVVALSLPSARQVLVRPNWDLPGTQRAFAAIANRLHWAGIDSGEELDRRLWGVAEAYVETRNEIAKPFAYYAWLAGVRQGWSMFSMPAKHPIELQIDVADTEGFAPIYRPHSSEYDFWGGKLGQYRFRAVTGRFPGSFDQASYNSLAKLLATNAAKAYPEAQWVRVRLYEYAIPPPAQVRADEKPEGQVEHVRLFRAEELR